MSAIQHVGLELAASCVDRELGFWGLLGFVEVSAPGELRERTRWLGRGTEQIHLLLVDEPVVPSRGHVAIVCSAYDEVVAALRAAGHEAAPRTEYWGAPRTQVRSPGGHLVELMAAPPG